MTREEQNNIYSEVLRIAEESSSIIPTLRHLAKNDLFFLLTRICKRKDLDNDWLYDRIREVEANPNGYLDLWCREHSKTSIITFGMTIKDILNNPEITVGIFSYKISIAAGFVRNIRREFEENQLLKELFPDILYENPRHQAPQWCEEGIIVKRRGNPKEATVESAGLVESQPTSRHYLLCVFDDIVTDKSVTTPEQIKRTTEAWELSLNLLAQGGVRRYVGTRYSQGDTWGTIMERGAAIPRIHPGTDDGTSNGKPVLWTQEYFDERKKSMSNYQFSCQVLLTPRSEDSIGFQAEWLRFWPAQKFNKLNIYIFVDPANTKNKRSDYTAMMVVGMGEDENYYIIDMVRDRLDLTEKARTLMKLVRDYSPKTVYYESYGAQADIAAMKDVMNQEQFRFDIKPVSGKLGKQDRIMRLLPLFEQHKVYLPDKCIRSNRDGVAEDLTKIFINNEFLQWPYARHEDMLDALARIRDDNVHIVPPAKNRGRRKIKVKTEYNSF